MASTRIPGFVFTDHVVEVPLDHDAPDDGRTIEVFAAVYYDDMYVDADLQLDTARRVGNVRAWVTSEYEHDGLRADRPRVVGRLNGHARRRGLADGRLARRVRGPHRR